MEKLDGQAFTNVYDDEARASSYAALDFPGTYHLAFRDLPAILASHVQGPDALDFGCGAGRSTRFLRRHGFRTVGVDIAASMVARARAADPAGDYGVIGDGDFAPLDARRFDLVLSAFAFDNIPGREWRAELLRRLGALLLPGGRIVILGSTPEIYVNEWASFTTKDFPENRLAKSGEPVRIVMTDVADARPVVDTVWFHDDYVALARSAGLAIAAEYRPLGRADEPIAWRAETEIAPWVIYVLAPRHG